MKTWVLPVNGTMYRVVLEKDTLDIWVNGTKVSFMPRQMLFFPCVQITPAVEKHFRYQIVPLCTLQFPVDF